MKRFLVVCLLLRASGRLLAGAPFDDLAWNRVLRAYVKGGLVDYRGLLRDQKDLDAFLNESSRVAKEEYEGWTGPGREAFMINLYNASTIKLVLDHYPVRSIRDIGHFWKGPWDQPVVRLWGLPTTLHFLENRVLRGMGDPRIHFAVNCASLGCPKLQSEAYEPAKLDEQLDHSAREFLADPSKNRFDVSSGQVVLSPILSGIGKTLVPRRAASPPSSLPIFHPGKPLWCGIPASPSAFRPTTGT